MNDKPKRIALDTTPGAMPEKPPVSSDMPAYSAQIIFEMSNALGRIEENLKNVVKNTDDMDNRLKAIEHNASFVKGAVACAVVLIPICFGLVWWSLGDKVDNALKTLNITNSEKTN